MDKIHFSWSDQGNRRKLELKLKRNMFCAPLLDYEEVQVAEKSTRDHRLITQQLSMVANLCCMCYHDPCLRSCPEQFDKEPTESDYEDTENLKSVSSDHCPVTNPMLPKWLRRQYMEVELSCKRSREKIEKHRAQIIEKVDQWKLNRQCGMNIPSKEKHSRDKKGMPKGQKNIKFEISESAKVSVSAHKNLTSNVADHLKLQNDKLDALGRKLVNRHERNTGQKVSSQKPVLSADAPQVGLDSVVDQLSLLKPQSQRKLPSVSLSKPQTSSLPHPTVEAPCKHSLPPIVKRRTVRKANRPIIESLCMLRPIEEDIVLTITLQPGEQQQTYDLADRNRFYSLHHTYVVDELDFCPSCHSLPCLDISVCHGGYVAQFMYRYLQRMKLFDPLDKFRRVSLNGSSKRSRRNKTLMMPCQMTPELCPGQGGCPACSDDTVYTIHRGNCLRTTREFIQKQKNETVSDAISSPPRSAHWSI